MIPARTKISLIICPSPLAPVIASLHCPRMPPDRSRSSPCTLISSLFSLLCPSPCHFYSNAQLHAWPCIHRHGLTCDMSSPSFMTSHFLRFQPVRLFIVRHFHYCTILIRVLITQTSCTYSLLTLISRVWPPFIPFPLCSSCLKTFLSKSPWSHLMFTHTSYFSNSLL